MELILLLHGAIGAKDQLAGLEEKLSSTFTVHRLNFSGHGGSGYIEKCFSIKLFADDVLNYLDKKKITSVSVFGYSMGGYVALYLAKHHPERIHKIITLATKYKWDVAIAAKEINMLQATKIEEKLPAFAISLQKRHAPDDWKKILEKTAVMLFEMGKDNPLQKDDFLNIQHPALLIIGDKDKLVTHEETQEVCQSLPNGQLSILQNTPHPIELVNTAELAEKIIAFLK